jgi:hypothetical protein
LEEMMMNKLIIVVLAFAIATPALADDLIAPTWRGQQGTTFSEWTYDDDVDVYDWDGPDNSYFISHPAKEDPYQDPCSPGGAWFSYQGWGYDGWDGGDPCVADWRSSGFGRTGMVNFLYGSWDLNNFVHDQPAKDVWVQITYWNGDLEEGTPVDWSEVGYAADPGFDAGYWEGELADWLGDPEGEGSQWWETWNDPCDGLDYAYWEGDVSLLDPCNPAEETWPGETYADTTVESEVKLEDGWYHLVVSATLDVNPDYEYFAMGFVDVVLIDQIVIETLCYVPEPATMALLGLGSLMMIRRKKR